mgnify:CR=1 FL=1
MTVIHLRKSNRLFSALTSTGRTNNPSYGDGPDSRKYKAVPNVYFAAREDFTTHRVHPDPLPKKAHSGDSYV